jgi:hypothetical protein
MKTKNLFRKGVNLVTLSSFLFWNIAMAAPVVTIPHELITRANTFTLPTNTGSDAGAGWTVSISDSNGDTIEVCDEKGCVVAIVKTH